MEIIRYFTGKDIIEDTKSMVKLKSKIECDKNTLKKFEKELFISACHDRLLRLLQAGSSVMMVYNIMERDHINFGICLGAMIYTTIRGAYCDLSRRIKLEELEDEYAQRYRRNL